MGPAVHRRGPTFRDSSRSARAWRAVPARMGGALRGRDQVGKDKDIVAVGMVASAGPGPGGQEPSKGSSPIDEPTGKAGGWPDRLRSTQGHCKLEPVWPLWSAFA